METICTECNNPIEIDATAETGDVVICANCGAELEVVNTNPPEVAVLEEGK